MPKSGTSHTHKVARDESKILSQDQEVIEAIHWIAKVKTRIGLEKKMSPILGVILRWQMDIQKEMMSSESEVHIRLPQGKSPVDTWMWIP